MKKFVEYKLDKVRNIKIGMAALSKIKNKAGKSINKMNFEDDMDFYEVAIILWAGMFHEDPELTPEKVMDLVDEYSDIPTALQIMGEAMQEAFGSPNEVRTAEQTKSLI